ncbi:multidrug efflux RND transporter permease subunit [Shewanella sp. OPT22]|nr:multidrug efflux RND transporter permease subunit [Shewanella sp. OPT22]
MISKYFIERPITAVMLSLLFVICGAISVGQLPTTEYPDVAPPTVIVQAKYPGATPKLIAETVASPIELEINGVDNMLYMSSQATADGLMKLTVTFAIGTDIDIAQAQVQNRVERAKPRLPVIVQRLGVVTEKTSPILTMLVHLYSTDENHDLLYLSNYANLYVKDELQRIKGVGATRQFGFGEYSLRVWLDPYKVSSVGLSPIDIVKAIKQQNQQVAAGSLGAEPMVGANFELLINVKGRLSDVEEFKNIIIKVGENDQVVRLKDVARVELGSESYVLNSKLNNSPAVAVPIYQANGANAIQISDDVRAKMKELEKHFPAGLEYALVFDPTVFVQESISSVIETLIDAVFLVILVVVLFLQTWRASIIPLLAVPVSLIGTFSFMHLMGFSLNALSLFGLVLAIGIVVDDAIVVVENVERNIAEGLKPLEATKRAMEEVTSPIIATTMVLIAVFVPTAFMTGLTGEFYIQFALTLTISTIISAINSLTLSPALSALLLKPHDAPKDWLSKSIDWLLGWIFRPFNKFFHWLSESYGALVSRLVRISGVIVIVYLGLLSLTGFQFQNTPTAYVPPQDKQYLISYAQLPDAASLDRTQGVTDKMTEIALKHPGVTDVFSMAGLSINGFTNSTNQGIVFVTLDKFENRTSPELSASAIAKSLNGEFQPIQEAKIAVFNPAPVRGLGTIGGFKLQIEDRTHYGFDTLFKVTEEVIEKSKSHPELAKVFTSYHVNVPQIEVAVDRTKAMQIGVSIQDVFIALQSYLGKTYVNDFNLFGRTYQVNIQAEQSFRDMPEDITQIKVSNNKGEMIPLGTIIEVKHTVDPDRVMHYNSFVSADINGVAAAGYSSDQARSAIEEVLAEALPDGMNYEWTDITYQQILAGNTGGLIFLLVICLVFMVLAAQYESLKSPIAIILIIPMTMLSALTGVWIYGGNNNIFTQIGLIVLVALATKNAILIVEFAKELQAEGKEIKEAIITACKLRLRPILMTSFAFIMGVLPLVFSVGAGSEMRKEMGVAVFSGMLGVTFFGLILTPVFYYLLMRKKSK